MKKYLLYHPSTQPTGKMLADAMSIPSGSSLQERVDVLIRWGNAGGVAYNPKVVINSKNALLGTQNKKDFLLTIKRMGFNAPRIYSIENARHIKNFPVLGRRISHARGNDIVVFVSPDDIKRSSFNSIDYLVEFIPSDNEYRIHSTAKGCICAYQKVLPRDTKYVPPVYIRNAEAGWVFSRLHDVPKRLNSLAKNIINEFQLDFGTLDMLDADGSLVILEVNSGPRLGEEMLPVFKEKIQELIEEKWRLYENSGNNSTM